MEATPFSKTSTAITLYDITIPSYEGVFGKEHQWLTGDLQQYQAGDFGWIMTCTALVLLMVPGVGFFYSGLARRKSALALIWLSLMSIAIVGFQWFFWGYSLAFSHTGSAYIGNLSNFGLMKTLAQPSVGSTKIPDLLFCLYQGMFAAITYVSYRFIFTPTQVSH